jgi:hypothetical protein
MCKWMLRDTLTSTLVKILPDTSPLACALVTVLGSDWLPARGAALQAV